MLVDLQAVQENKYDYDSWYQYIRLMESEGLEKAEQIKELYERAIANIPPSQVCRYQIWLKIDDDNVDGDAFLYFFYSCVNEYLGCDVLNNGIKI